jgi:hypothetical protein
MGMIRWRARDRSRKAETLCGSVHESPVWPLPDAQTEKRPLGLEVLISTRALVCAAQIIDPKHWTSLLELFTARPQHSSRRQIPPSAGHPPSA